MKKLLFVFTLLFSFQAQAKYVQPQGIATQSDKSAIYMFNYLDTNKDDKLSLDEYKQKRMTRDVRRQIRKDKEEGRYMSPEEEFKAMDADGDGFISKSDLMAFLKSKSL